MSFSVLNKRRKREGREQGREGRKKGRRERMRKEGGIKEMKAGNGTK